MGGGGGRRGARAWGPGPGPPSAHALCSCRRLQSSDVVEALALDHLNDILSNVAALLTAGAAAMYADKVGAMP